MATKKKRTTKRRSISSGTPRSYGDMYRNDTTRGQSAPVTTQVSAPTAAATTQNVNLRAEYDYVVRDLRTLLLVSVILFAVIIVVGFFI